MNARLIKKNQIKAATTGSDTERAEAFAQSADTVIRQAMYQGTHLTDGKLKPARLQRAHARLQLAKFFG